MAGYIHSVVIVLCLFFIFIVCRCPGVAVICEECAENKNDEEVTIARDLRYIQVLLQCICMIFFASLCKVGHKSFGNFYQPDKKT